MATVFLILALATVIHCVYSDDVPRVRQEFLDKSISRLNAQITTELQASYLYQAYAHYFDRADVALPGFRKFFEGMSKEEREHAEMLMEYVNKRGGELSLSDIRLQDTCIKVSEELAKFNEFRRDTACICYFMSSKRETFINPTCGLRDMWHTGRWAMEDAIALERFVNEQLLSIHRDNEEDPHLTLILDHFLEEQVSSIKKFGDYIEQLKRVGTGLGEFMFDQKLQ